MNHVDPSLSQGSSPPDIRVEDHGSIVLLRPLNETADQWLGENLDPNALTFGNAVAVEPRYVGPIVAGAREAGLEVR
jgi:hypothetical protein